MDKRQQAKQIKAAERAQDRCVDRAVSRTEAVLYGAIDIIWNTFERTGHYFRPSLDGLFAVSADFYRQVIEEAFAHAKSVKKQDEPPRRPRRLASRKGPKGIPNTLRDLVELFGDRRYWPSILKRSKKQTERLRAEYLRKLERRFKKLLPQVTGGALSPAEAKNQLKEEWQTSKSRVETIFRTETTNYFAKTQRAFFNKDPEIIGFLFDSVKDRSRTPICRSRHGLIYRPNTKLLDENTPALHFNCRSNLIPLANTPENRKLLEDKSRDPEHVTVVDLPRGWRK